MLTFAKYYKTVTKCARDAATKQKSADNIVLFA